MVEKLKEHGYNGNKLEKEIVNHKFEKSESTPLICAASKGNLEMVKYLIDFYGVHTNYMNKNDENCLMAAVMGKHIEVVKHLCQT